MKDLHGTQASALQSFIARLGLRSVLLIVAAWAPRCFGMVLLTAVVCGLAGLPYWAALPLCGAVAVWVTLRYLLVPIGAARRPVLLARLAELRVPKLRDRLTSAVELAQRLSLEPLENAGMSSTLAREHIRLAMGGCCNVALSSVLPLRVLFPPLITAMLGLLAFTTFWAVAPERLMRSVSFGGAGRGISGREVAAGMVFLGDIDLEIRFPDYTGLGEKRLQNASGDINALKGSRVYFKARTDREIAACTVDCPGIGRLAFEVSGKDRIQGTFSVAEAGEYRFHFELPEGQPKRSSRPYRIFLAQDRFPEILFLRPEGDQEVLEGAGVELTYRAEDDYGLREIGLEFLTARGTRKRTVRRFDRLQTKAFGETTISMAALDVSPGEQLGVCFFAVDNDVISGPKTATSRTIYFTVKGKDEPLRAAMELEQRMFNELVLALGDNLMHPVYAGNPPTRIASGEAQIVAKLDALSGLMEEILGLLAEGGPEQEYFLDAMALMKQDMDRHLRARKPLLERIAALSAAPALPERDRREVERQADDATGQLEQDVLFLDNLLGKQRIDRVVMELERLRKLQRELSGLLQEYAADPSPELMEKIEKLISEINRRMQAVREALASLPGEIPREYLNLDSVENADLHDVQDLLSRLQEALYAGSGEQTLSLADDALRRLEELLSAVENSAQNYAASLDGKTQAALSALFNGIKDLQRDQKRLVESTGKIEKEILQKLLQDSGDSDAGFLKRELELAAQLRQELSRADELLRQESPRAGGDPRAPLSANHLPALVEDAARSAERLEEALRENQVDDALDTARETDSAVSVARGLRKWGKGPADPKPDPVAGHLTQGAALSREIRQKLERLAEWLSGAEAPDMNAGESQELSKSASEQTRLKERLDGLMQQFERSAEKDPSVGQVTDELGEAGGQMEQAAQHLGSNQLSAGRKRQRDALNSLQAFLDGFSESPGQQGASAGPPQMVRRRAGRSWRAQGSSGNEGDNANPDTRQVEIPRENLAVDFEALRKEILEGMKERPPVGFESPVRRYFKELIER